MEGLAAVQRRIADIQSRFAPPSPSFVAVPIHAPTTPDATTAPSRVMSASTTGRFTPVRPSGLSLAGAARADGAWAARLPAEGQRWSGEIEQAAQRHGLDPALLASLVWAESGFDPSAVSHAGATGLAQLMPGTAAGLGVNPHDPVQNLDGGARYLREQLDRFGSPDLALAAYNAGPGRVARAGGIPDITETRTYVARVLDHLAHLTR